MQCCMGFYIRCRVSSKKEKSFREKFFKPFRFIFASEKCEDFAKKEHEKDRKKSNSLHQTFIWCKGREIISNIELSEQRIQQVLFEQLIVATIKLMVSTKLSHLAKIFSHFSFSRKYFTFLVFAIFSHFAFSPHLFSRKNAKCNRKCSYFFAKRFVHWKP